MLGLKGAGEDHECHMMLWNSGIQEKSSSTEISAIYLKSVLPT